MASLLRLVGLLLALGLTWAPPVSAKVRLTLKVHRVASDVDYVQASRSIAIASVRDGRRYLLINDRRRQGTYLAKAGGCTLRGFAVPWILFDSCPSFAHIPWDMLYNVDTHKWTPFKCEQCVSDYGVAWGFRRAIGSRWLWFEHPDGCPGEQYGNPCSPSVFVRIPSGATRTWNQNPGMAADLDSPDLVRRFCWSLPPGLIAPFGAPTAPLVSQLFWDGRYSVQPLYRPGGPYTLSLEDCRSQLHIALLTAPSGPDYWFMTANSRALVWWLFGSRTLKGVFIHHLQQFAAALPVVPRTNSPFATLSLALTSQRLYIVDATHQLWAATGPKPRNNKQ